MKKSYALGIIIITALIASWYFFSHKANTTNNEKIKINIIGENSSTVQAMMALEQDYEKLNPNIDLVFHPNTFDDAFNKSNQDFANKTGLYDIVIQYNFSLSSFVENNYVYNLQDLNQGFDKKDLAFESSLFTNYWKELGYYYKNSKVKDEGLIQVGYPSAALTMLLMYNKELFNDENNKKAFKAKYNSDLNPPTTWEDYYKIAEFFSNNSKGTKGVCIEGSPGGFLYFELMNFIGSMGGKILESERGWDSNLKTNVVINSKQNIDALTFYKRLKSLNQGGYSNVEQFEQMKIMKDGKTAMSIVWSDMIYPSIKTTDGFDQRFGFAPIPGNTSILGGGAFFVNKQTKHKEEVSKFINYLLQKSTQIKLASNGYCSPLRDIYKDEQIKKLPYANALGASLERAKISLVAGPDANMIYEVLTTYVQKCWNNELTPEEALNKAQAEVKTKRQEIFAGK